MKRRIFISICSIVCVLCVIITAAVIFSRKRDVADAVLLEPLDRAGPFLFEYYTVSDISAYEYAASSAGAESSSDAFLGYLMGKYGGHFAETAWDSLLADRAIAQVESAALKGGYLISNADISLRHQDEQNMVSYTLTLTVQDRDGSEPFELKQYGRLKIENGLIEEIYPDNIRDLASLTYPAA